MIRPSLLTCATFFTGMMPLWLFLLGSYLTDGDLVIPYTQLIVTLIL